MVRVRRRVAAIGTLVLCAWLGLTACTPGEATPTPTPTGFTSEEEAFAAAEATYRAYVDALNRVDLSDPATFEDVYAWTTGDALDGEKRSLTEMRAEGWTVSGGTRVMHIEADVAQSFVARGTVVLRACSDVSAVSVVDAGGNSVVSPDRPAIQAVEIELTEVASSELGWLISDLRGADFECSGS